MKQDKQKSFTLIELLVVMAIIGILAGVIVSTSVTGAERARDTRRVQEVYQIAHALQLYYADKRQYPDNTDSGDTGCFGDWDGGSILNGEGDTFIEPLITEGFLSAVPIEQKPTGTDDWEKCSYRYIRTTNPCACSGTYAVLYATCETDKCPVEGQPACFDGCWDEGGSIWDKKDIAIYFKE